MLLILGLLDRDDIFARHSHAEGVITELTGMGTGDCGFDFETGQAYLTYAEAVRTRGRLRAPNCLAKNSVAFPAVRLLSSWGR
jgi:hypothetical protein